MNQDTVKKIVALGALTGMRSMAGIATLASARPGAARPLLALAAAAEMVADKTALAGDRIDPLPLAGRIVIGAAVGAVIAGEQRQNPLAGGMLGAATALVATHLAYHARRRLRLPNVAGGLIEDSLVVAIASRYA